VQSKPRRCRLGTAHSGGDRLAMCAIQQTRGAGRAYISRNRPGQDPQ